MGQHRFFSQHFLAKLPLRCGFLEMFLIDPIPGDTTCELREDACDLGRGILLVDLYLLKEEINPFPKKVSG